MSLFKLEKVTKIYPPYFKALIGIDLIIEENDFVLLTGATGAGKTTLLKLLYKAEVPTSGEIYFKSIPYSKMSKKTLKELRKKMGIVFQDHKLFLDLSVYENIKLSLILSNKPPKKLKLLIYEFLERFGLASKAKKRVKELSGGERQKVGIIRAIIRNPQIIIADEPTGNLDPDSIREVVKVFKEFHSKGKTVILATHDPVILKESPGKIITLNRGELVNYVENS